MPSKTWYVSPAGSGIDGKSWRSGWRTLDDIDWAVVQPGDTIFIDGGTSSITYSGYFDIQKAGTKNSRIKLRQSLEPGHNGNIIIITTNLPIELKSCVDIIGTRWRGITVNDGFIVANDGGNLLRNIEVTLSSANSNGAPPIRGTNLTLDQVIVHLRDNGLNPPTNLDLSGSSILNRCWIYNDELGSYARGVDFSGNSLNIRDSIFGPGLWVGLSGNGSGNVNIDGALFNNPTDIGVVINNNMPFCMRNVTSFVTKLSNHVMTATALYHYQGTSPFNVYDSVVYGGAVLLNPGLAGTGNTQFGTSGNTTALSSRMVDPQFVTNVGAYPANVSWTTLVNTDFSLSRRSPARGTGARITSVKQLLGDSH